MADVILRRGRVTPSLFRHPWVFSGSVGSIKGEVKDGDIVTVVDERGTFIARGLINQNSQIVVRLFSWDSAEKIDDDFFRRKVETAARLRERVLPLSENQTARRVVFSEGDNLSGLIADQFGEYLVVQFQSLAMNVRRETILDSLEKSFRPRGIYERSDSPVREKEGMEKFSGVVRGEEPPERLLIRDGGVQFEINTRSGQKSGHYLDQRENRIAVAKLAKGRRVLDMFTYSGGFAIAASLGGAEHITAVDSSAPALELAARNAELNGCTNINFVQSGAIAYLCESEEKFGAVILDPPAFAKSSHNVEAALNNYVELYTNAMRLIEPEGTLAVCCCSQHIQSWQLVRALNIAGVNSHRMVRVLELRGQPSDHPVAANCPETAYLKCLITQVD